MTKDMKKIIGYAVSTAVVDVAGGMVALDIFNKAISNLPLKKSTFRSIGLFGLRFGVFNGGMDFADNYTNGTLKSIFGIDKMDTKQVADDMVKELAKKINGDTENEEATAEEARETLYDGIYNKIHKFAYGTDLFEKASDDISEESEEEEEE